METVDYIQRDINSIWHPYTQMKDLEKFPPVLIEKAIGAKLFASDGKFYYDTISSWWCNIHGHCHPGVMGAIREQTEKLDHVIFAGFTHAPAIELAEELLKIAPRNLKKVFFSDNGSTAVEVAMKMSFQYWKNIGLPEKENFLSLDSAYHGDTIGAMSVSGNSIFNNIFKPLLFGSFKAKTPYCYRCPFSKKYGECSFECLKDAENIIKLHFRKIAAVILEPMVLCAGGMIVYPKEYLKGIEELCRKYDIHLIADEVATGFARTGKMFAVNHAEVNPDFMCLSKGITSGSLSLGATLTTPKIFNAFYDDYEKMKTFYHGHTHTANPIACSSAVKSIKLFSEENTLKKIERINRKMSVFLSNVKKMISIVGDTREIGLIGAIELVKNRNTKEHFLFEERIGFKIYNMGLEKNILLRPLGNVIYFFLPACLEDDELDYIFSASYDILSAIEIRNK
ncbi:adenosylmethionine-8-amino-7-oxononanoate aminotransferase [Candidatus Omnitrophus magneticus]|uniref:Adenosylmethionine-8-amino-7-oxononanoate aminotransferase n=1 Tax=Candidatus Omnitrophus magneticus TaxID=1609969 RepID=A0A0F0CND5_9BACT|nr:adenosylmethionine-8-amino-7-oxononanoate aminotransferase [Candidatus Omnitrophus magneticus]